MPTALDTSLIPLVKSLIEEFGVNATFTEKIIGTYDPATGTGVPNAAAGVVVKVSPPSPYESRLIDGELIRQGDMVVYLPAENLTFTPRVGMAVIITGTTFKWKATSINQIWSGEQIAVYEIQLRH